jgi:hypothetical protein
MQLHQLKKSVNLIAYIILHHLHHLHHWHRLHRLHLLHRFHHLRHLHHRHLPKVIHPRATHHTTEAHHLIAAHLLMVVPRFMAALHLMVAHHHMAEVPHQTHHMVEVDIIIPQLCLLPRLHPQLLQFSHCYLHHLQPLCLLIRTPCFLEPACKRFYIFLMHFIFCVVTFFYKYYISDWWVHVINNIFPFACSYISWLAIICMILCILWLITNHSQAHHFCWKIIY